MIERELIGRQERCADKASGWSSSVDYTLGDNDRRRENRGHHEKKTNNGERRKVCKEEGKETKGSVQLADHSPTGEPLPAAYPVE